MGIRWYGFFVALSAAVGLYYFVREGKKKGFSEDFLYSVALGAILGGIVGARLLFVLLNWPDYASQPWEIIRIDHGGLAWHGALFGGLIGGGLVLRGREGFHALADLTVPGLCVGYMLVRIGNVFNQELLGRPTELWWFGRHPAQLYGSLSGLVLLLLHLRLSRRSLPDGYRFWSWFLYYSVFRFFEEAFRSSRLYLPVYLDERLGMGFFTLAQLFTPLFLLGAYLIRRRLLRAWRAAGHF